MDARRPQRGVLRLEGGWQPAGGHHPRHLAPALVVGGGAAGLQLFAVRDEAFGGVGTAVQQHVFHALAQRPAHVGRALVQAQTQVRPAFGVEHDFFRRQQREPRQLRDGDVLGGRGRLRGGDARFGLPEGAGREIWREPLRKIGRAFGRETRAERFIADYEGRAEEVKGRMAERWRGAKFAVVDLNADGIYVAGTVQDPASQVLFGDLGVEPASLVAPAARQISLEAVSGLDADVILAGVRWKEGSLERDLEAVATTVESPLWQRVPAVRKDQVYRFYSEIAYTTPLCARTFLDFVERDLLG